MSHLSFFQSPGELCSVSAQNFEKIYKSYFPFAFRFFLKKGFSESEAQDLTQDVFLRVYKSWDRYRDEVAAIGWVKTVAANVWKNEIRRIKSEKHGGQVFRLHEIGEVATTLENAEEKARETEFREQLDKALSDLPQAMRATLILRIHKDLKYQEIARLMGVTVNTVKKQLHEAKKRLRDQIGVTISLDDE